MTRQRSTRLQARDALGLLKGDLLDAGLLCNSRTHALMAELYFLPDCADTAWDRDVSARPAPTRTAP